MRATSLTLLSVAVLFAAASATVQENDPDLFAGLRGSKHDFSAEQWTGGDMCVACHSPKSELPPEAPLWNPSADFNRVFGDAIRRTDHTSTLPGEGTLICLRCHDGTIAQDMLGGLATPTSTNTAHPALLSTGHGGTNHPVGVDYPAFDADYRPLAALLSEGKVVLPQGKVECVSCHDPHNQSGGRHMLVKSNHRSALCLTCHKK